MECLKIALFVTILFFASLQDIREREVDNKYTVFLLLIGLINVNLSSLLGLGLSFLVFMIVGLITNLGGADVKIASACGFVLGSPLILFALLIGLSLSVIAEVLISISKKESVFKREYALVPYITLGCVVTIILKGLIFT